MSSEIDTSFKLDRPESTSEISELIKLTLDLTGLIQRRFEIHRDYRQAQVVGDIRGLLADVFEIDLITNNTFANFIAGGFDDGPRDETKIQQLSFQNIKNNFLHEKRDRFWPAGAR
jgi:hypothetical protein